MSLARITEIFTLNGLLLVIALLRCAPCYGGC